MRRVWLGSQWPCGKERVIVNASRSGAMTVPPFSTPRRPSIWAMGQSETSGGDYCFLAEANLNSRPFRCTKDPHKIIAAVKRGHQLLDSIH